MNVFIPGVALMGLLFGVLAAYPFVEQWVTGDKRVHHLLERPRNAPTRTAFGAAGITAYGLLWISGGNDIIATQFHLDFYWITRTLRVALFVGPVIAFIVTRRICIGLQRKDAEVVLHGYETGIIMRSPDGTYTERHLPVSPASGVGAHRPRPHQGRRAACGDRRQRCGGARQPRRNGYGSGCPSSGSATTSRSPPPKSCTSRTSTTRPEELEAADDEFGGVNELASPAATDP